MENKTTRITYGACGVLASPFPALQDNTSNLTGLKRIQNADTVFSFNRKRFEQIGATKHTTDINLTAPDISLNLGYLYSDGTNEVLLGLNVDGANSSVLSGFRGLNRSNNFYLIFGTGDRDEPFNNTIFKNRFNVMALGDCYLSDYSISATQNDFVRVSAGLKADNLDLRQYNNDTLGELTPSVDRAQKKPNTTYRYKVESGFFHDTSNLDAEVEPAFAPSGIKLTLPEVNVPGNLLTGNRGYSSLINSLSLSFSVPRKTIYGFGSMYPYDRRCYLPTIGNLTFSATANEFQSGALNDIVSYSGNMESGFNFVVDMISCDGETGLQINVDKAKFDNENFNFSIGTNGVIETSLSFSIDEVSGLRFSTPPLILNDIVENETGLFANTTGQSPTEYSWFNSSGSLVGSGRIHNPTESGYYYYVANNNLGQARSSPAFSLVSWPGSALARYFDS